MIVIRCAGGNAAIDITLYRTALNRNRVVLRILVRTPACGNAAWQFRIAADGHLIVTRRTFRVFRDAAIHCQFYYTFAAYLYFIIVGISGFAVAAVNRIA